MTRFILRWASLIYGLASIWLATTIEISKIIPYRCLRSFPYDSHHCVSAPKSTLIEVHPLMTPVLVVIGVFLIVVYVVLSEER